eukprot:CAMPEP_0168627060 /NCGR_PEP_ID=MMETSP0449_2-20121227/11007_1 /TAXON_ID=1082188 /ORGANISM="Strombidium rassoulzadegani, Strain ras09" /LENGTH=45 /DNA_ID= /DNA_START= /DNA_END= /DNA_ORIENTATION=
MRLGAAGASKIPVASEFATLDEEVDEGVEGLDPQEEPQTPDIGDE